jgi:hypothetical protein
MLSGRQTKRRGRPIAAAPARDVCIYSKIAVSARISLVTLPGESNEQDSSARTYLELVTGTALASPSERRESYAHDAHRQGLLIRLLWRRARLLSGCTVSTMQQASSTLSSFWVKQIAENDMSTRLTLILSSVLSLHA